MNKLFISLFMFLTHEGILMLNVDAYVKAHVVCEQHYRPKLHHLRTSVIHRIEGYFKTRKSYKHQKNISTGSISKIRKSTF